MGHPSHYHSKKIQVKPLTAVDFITSIVTVRITITVPAMVDAFTRTTKEVIRRAGCRSKNILTLHPRFIRFISAIYTAVTYQTGRDTFRICATKLMWSTGMRRTILFITAITTFIFTITYKGHRNASANGASKLICTARKIA